MWSVLKSLLFQHSAASGARAPSSWGIKREAGEESEEGAKVVDDLSTMLVSSGTIVVAHPQRNIFLIIGVLEVFFLLVHVASSHNAYGKALLLHIL